MNGTENQLKTNHKKQYSVKQLLVIWILSIIFFFIFLASTDPESNSFILVGFLLMSSFIIGVVSFLLAIIRAIKLLANKERKPMQLSDKSKNVLRWIATPLVIFIAKPISAIIFYFQSWFISPDSFYYTTIIPLLVELVTGYLMIYLVHYTAPSHKKTVTNIIYGAFMALLLISYAFAPEEWLLTTLSIVGMTGGMYYVHTEEKNA